MHFHVLLRVLIQSSSDDNMFYHYQGAKDYNT